MTTTWTFRVEAEAGVVPAASASCADAHPGQECPGLPHEED